MKAARLYGAKDVRIEQVPDPEPGAGEVLMRVRAVSICPSDWRLWVDGDAGGAPLQEPIIQGHEFSGDVIEQGAGVTDPPIDARIAVEPTWHCGECDMCRRGMVHLCRNVVFPSFPPYDGALAELIACPIENVEELPQDTSYIDGALTEPMGVAMHGVRLADAGPDQQVAILGAGAVGLFTLMLCKLDGIEDVTIVEPVEGRRELAAQYGASRTARTYQELTGEGYEPEVVLECSGSPGAAAEAMELAGLAAKVIVVGIPHPETISFEAHLPRRKELTIIFSRRSRETLRDCVELVGSGKIDMGAIPVRRYSLEETSAAIAATADRPGDMLRAIVEP